MEIKIDEKELSSIIAKKEPKKFNLDKLLLLLQSLAIISAGMWAVFNYINFDKEKNRLELESQKLRNTIDSSSILKKYDLSSAIEVKKIDDYNSHEGLFQFTCTITGKNNSLKPLEVTGVIIEVFSTDILNNKTLLSENQVYVMPYPPPAYKHDSLNFPWKRIYSRMYKTQNDTNFNKMITNTDFVTTYLKLNPGKEVTKGGGCGVYGPGQTMRTPFRFFIRASKKQYIGYKFYVLLDQISKEEDIMNVHGTWSWCTINN